jgi:RHS repeat-associated protein
MAENGEGEPTTYRYDANNNLISMTEPKGADCTTHYRYDELNKLIAVDETPRDPSKTAAGVTRFFYDGNRNKIAQQAANKNLVSYAYDALNRLTDTFQHTVPGSLTDATARGLSPTNNPAGGDVASALPWHFGYDLNGNQNLIVDARKQEVILTYDWLDRLISRTYSKHSEKNPATGEPLRFQPIKFSYEYDGNGNPTNIVEEKQFLAGTVSERTEMSYDSLDRMRSRTRFDHDASAGRKIEYAYDAQGNRTEVVDPDGRKTKYTFDERNRLSTATTEFGLPTARTTRYTYWEDGLPKTTEYLNAAGLVSTISDRSMTGAYDKADRVRLIENRAINPVPALLSRYAYTYDKNGNRTIQEETQSVFNGGLADSTSYLFDALNRLTNVTYGSAGYITYTYEPNGNRLTEEGKDPVTGALVDRHYHYDAGPSTFAGVNALRQIQDVLDPTKTIHFEYDQNLNQAARIQGNLRQEFHYDIRDQILVWTNLMSGVATDVAAFDYNHERLRAKKFAGGGAETRYLYDQNSVLVEYGNEAASFNTIHKYNYGYSLLSLTRYSPVREQDFYLTDGLGSTVNLTDDSGGLKHSYRYDAWGRVRATTPDTYDNPRQYTGHYKDNETGLHYFGARYYDEETGRFLSQDPYLGEANTPPSLHRYLYAYANPLRYLDLTGYKVTMTTEGEPQVKTPERVIDSETGAEHLPWWNRVKTKTREEQEKERVEEEKRALERKKTVEAWVGPLQMPDDLQQALYEQAGGPSSQKGRPWTPVYDSQNRFVAYVDRIPDEGEVYHDATGQYLGGRHTAGLEQAQIDPTLLLGSGLGRLGISLGRRGVSAVLAALIERKLAGRVLAKGTATSLANTGEAKQMAEIIRYLEQVSPQGQNLGKLKTAAEYVLPSGRSVPIYYAGERELGGALGVAAPAIVGWKPLPGIFGKLGIKIPEWTAKEIVIKAGLPIQTEAGVLVHETTHAVGFELRPLLHYLAIKARWWVPGRGFARYLIERTAYKAEYDFLGMSAQYSVATPLGSLNGRYQASLMADLALTGATISTSALVAEPMLNDANDIPVIPAVLPPSKVNPYDTSYEILK